jgi:hypothetical protein
MFGFLAGSSTSNSILNSANEKIIQIVPGFIDDGKMAKHIYVLSDQNIQKWKMPFSSPEVVFLILI